MKAALFALWILSVAVAFAAARWTAPTAAEGDPPSAAGFRAALQERDELARAYAISRNLQVLGPDNLVEMLEALDAHQSGVTPAEVRLLMVAWSRFDAPGAFSWARSWPTRWSDTLMAEALWAWGYRDGVAAMQALEATGDPELIARLRPSLMEGWLRSEDRARATEYVASIDEPKRRRRLTFVLAAEAARDGADTAIAWVESVPEDLPNAFKQGAFYHAASAIARYEPRRAADWFVAHRDAWYSEGSLDVIARKWVLHYDPLPVFEWLLGLPAVEGERANELPDAVAGAFRMWLDKDREAASEWLASVLPDVRLDGAIAELVRTGARSAPENAAAWAERIQDPKQRRRSLLIAGRNWVDVDPVAARAWLEAGDFPEDFAESILNSSRTAAKLRAQAAAAATP